MPIAAGFLLHLVLPEKGHKRRAPREHFPDLAHCARMDVSIEKEVLPRRDAVRALADLTDDRLVELVRAKNCAATELFTMLRYPRPLFTK